MTRSSHATTETSAFALPADLPSSFVQTLQYWDSLKRGEAQMPFADDFHTSGVEAVAPWLMILETRDVPPRLRCSQAGPEIERLCGAGPLAGRFLDEVPPAPVLKLMQSQAYATLELGRPTFLRGPGDRDGSGYERLLLPFWGDGRVSMLLCCLARAG